MASGQQKAAENLERFRNWIAERWAANDWADYIRGSQLNRKEIAAECDFATSVLRQNPQIKQTLEELEANLRDREILPVDNRPASDKAAQRREALSRNRDKERIKALEEQNAALKAEVESLRETLKRYELIDEHLAETGRMIKP